MISFFRATICFMRSTTILVLSRYGAVVKLWHEVFKSSTHNVKKICVKVQDQIDVTKQLVDLYPFIDKSRVRLTLVCLFSTAPCDHDRLPFGDGVTVVS